MPASGASAPDCSTSSVVSPEPAFRLTLPAPPSTLSSLIRFALVLMLSVVDQKCVASEVRMLASVTMPMVWPWPR